MKSWTVARVELPIDVAQKRVLSGPVQTYAERVSGTASFLVRTDAGTTHIQVKLPGSFAHTPVLDLVVSLEKDDISTLVRSRIRMRLTQKVLCTLWLLLGVIGVGATIANTDGRTVTEQAGFAGTLLILISAGVVYFFVLPRRERPWLQDYLRRVFGKVTAA